MSGLSGIGGVSEIGGVRGVSGIGGVRGIGGMGGLSGMGRFGGFRYRTMIEEILGVPNKITAYTDNKSVIEAVFLLHKTSG